MKTSCIHHPENHPYIQIYAWMIPFCDGNHCAAFLLAHFCAWHNYKMDHDEYYCRANDISEAHGDGRQHNEDAYLFFSTEELIAGIFCTFSKNSVLKALDLLQELTVITIHDNPNPRYHFDKTKYFKFYPEVCNQWLQDNRSLFTPVKQAEKKKRKTALCEFFDRLKMNDRASQNKQPSVKNKQPSVKNEQPSFKSERPITDKPNNKPNNKPNIQSINTHKILTLDQEKIHPVQPPILDEENNKLIQPILDALTARGLPAKRLHYSDALSTLKTLAQEGAGVEIFCEAYDLARSTTKDSGFGVNYLAKVVRDLLNKTKQSKANTSISKHYRSASNAYIHHVSDMDLSNGAHWLTEKRE